MLNIWIGQSAAVKADVVAIKGGAAPKTAIKGTVAERRAYADVASKIADSTDGFFKSPAIDAVPRVLESIYVDSVDDIAKLEKGGAIILGAWDWNGERVEGYDLHPSLIDFMPSRKTYDKDGVETGTLDPVLEDVVLAWGQAPRQFS